MQNSVRKTVLILVGIVVFVFASFIFKYAINVTEYDQELTAMNAHVLKQPLIIKPFTLMDHHNQPFSHENLKGKWSLLFFGFTYCPDICPTTLSILNHAKTKLDITHNTKEPLQIVLVSVDPERDTPEKLAQYITHFNKDFIGLTGDLKTIGLFARNLNASFVKAPGGTPENYLVDHSAQIVLVNPKGDYYGFIKPPHNADNIVKFFKMAQEIYRKQL